MSQKLQLTRKYLYLETVILSITHFITCLNKSNLDCWLLITVQEIVVAEQNIFNILIYNFTGINKNLRTCILLVYLFNNLFPLLKKRILETNEMSQNIQICVGRYWHNIR